MYDFAKYALAYYNSYYSSQYNLINNEVMLGSLR